MKYVKSLLLLLFVSVAVSAADVPRLKLAITSDIHARWASLEKVYAFLAAKNPDAVLFCGDLTLSVADVESYKTYRKIYEKHFSKCKVPPVHIAIPGNHDFWAPKGTKRAPAKESLKRFFTNIGMKPEWLRHTVVKGYSIIAVSATDEKGENKHTPEEVKQVSDLIGKAEKAAPGKPVFVMTHCPPAFTMSGSEWKKRSEKNRGWYWRYDLVRQMFENHPQAVSLSGHTHLALQDERAIWQGDFTAINVGVLPRITLKKPGKLVGSLRPGFASHGRSFTWIEVFDKYMLIYRYDANTMKEINPEKRWRIELPYTPEKAIYTDKRFEKTVAPEFAPGAKAEIVANKRFYFLRTDRAKHPEMVHSYKVRLKFDDKKYKTLEFYVGSDFYLPQKERRPKLQFPADVKVVPGAAGTMEITPVEPFGREGKTLVTKFKIPAKK